MGKLTVSLDFEIGWGAVESERWKLREQKGVYRDLRPILREMIAQLDDYGISLTWATVGAMVSEPTPEDFDHLPEKYRKMLQEFLSKAEQSTRDGRDLIGMLLSMKTLQDIGSHSYSHTRFHIPSYSEKAKLIDLKKGVQALRNLGIEPQSFVYPVNQVENVDLLEKAGLSIVRLPPQRAESTTVQKIAHSLFSSPPTACRESLSERFETETGSMLYNWRNKKDFGLRRYLTLYQIRKGFSTIKKSDHHLHLWFHPFNLAEIYGLKEFFFEILKDAAKLRDTGHIDIVPMAPLSANKNMTLL